MQDCPLACLQHKKYKPINQPRPTLSLVRRGWRKPGEVVLHQPHSTRLYAFIFLPFQSSKNYHSQLAKQTTQPHFPLLLIREGDKGDEL
jgi:hypothetical protein